MDYPKKKNIEGKKIGTCENEGHFFFFMSQNSRDIDECDNFAKSRQTFGVEFR